MLNKNYFLFSIDLEDTTYESNYIRNPNYFEHIVDKYLDFLDSKNFKTTFFTLGRVAKLYPHLVKRIYKNGHEIACHSYNHTPIDRLNKHDFREDLLKCLDIYSKLGITGIKGYRAPLFSLTQKTSWVYEILYDLKFKYSSSVLPAKNPLYGWPDFNVENYQSKSKIVEYPISLNQFKLPIGGLYLRTLPYLMNKVAIKNYFNNDKPLFSYLHPYDIDAKDPTDKFAYLGNNFIFHWLMKYNREKSISLINQIVENFNAQIVRYDYYLDSQA